MDPWYKVVTPRKEAREGRSFNPDEFAIALEQVVAGTAPQDYKDPDKFFSRTYFTRALKDHAGMVLRRLSGKTESTAPVLTLITQFGGGNRGQSARLSTQPLRSLLSLSPSNTLCLSKEVAASWPIPADTWHTGHVCSVDLLGFSERP